MNLVILSKHAQAYRNEMESLLPSTIGITQCIEQPHTILEPQRIDMLLGEPDLCAQVVDKCTNLQWLQSTWAGITPLLHCKNKNFHLTGIKNLFGKQMREYIFNYLLHFSRCTDEFMQLQRLAQWQPLQTSSLYGKTLGIAGVGSIGKDVAKLAKAFDMKVSGLTRSSQDCPFVDRYFSLDQKHDFAAGIDFLIVLLPDTKETKGLIDQKMISQLPAHCIVINAGRAATIDNTALIRALDDKQIRAAVLDVFEQEPLPAQDPLWQQENLIITQHSSAISKVEEITEVFLTNLSRFTQQLPLNYQVNWNKGY